MTGLDEICFKIPLGTLAGAKEEVDLITAPEITIPDYLTILQETEYDCSLEKSVLTGLQSGYTGQPSSPAPRCPSEVLPSCPPYWQMFSSPRESRRSADLWEACPRRRSHSLNAADARAAAESIVSDSGEEGGGSSEEEERGWSGGPGSGSSRPGLRRGRSPDPPGPSGTPSLPGHHRRKNQLQPSARQSSLSALDTIRGGRQKTPRPPGPDLAPPPSSHRPPNARAHTATWTPSIKHHRPTQPSLSPNPRAPPPPSLTPRPAGSHAGAPDASAELLSALGPEERELLEAITERGYPLRTAIIALQKTGQQSPEKILSYLEACERLCELGHEQAQVEEALEMFHNSETKAAEFLHLLAQFNEMGFQLETIKEVLLVHENHGERALEELMTRVV